SLCTRPTAPSSTPTRARAPLRLRRAATRRRPASPPGRRPPTTRSGRPRAAILDTDDVVDVIIVAGSALLEARSDADIDAFTFGFAGALSAGGSGTAIGIAGAGAGSGNSIVNTIEAAVRGASLTTTGDVSLEAEDDSSIHATAGSGALSIAAGESGVGVGLGLSITINEVGNQVLAIVDDSDVHAGGDVSLTALSTSDIEAEAIGAAVSVAAGSSGTAVSVAATGTVADNRIHNTIRAAIEDTAPASANSVQAGGSISLDASDNSHVDSFGFAGSVSVSASSSGTSVSGSVGVGIALNTIANDISAYVAHMPTVDADGSISINARSDAAIKASTNAAALSIAGGSGTSVAISGGGAFSQNVILTTTNAYVLDSNLEAGTALVEGDIDIDAGSASSIDAFVLAASAAVAAGSGTSVAPSIGISLARNFIGWDPNSSGPHDYTSDQVLQTSLQKGKVVEVTKEPPDAATPDIPTQNGPRTGDRYEYIGETRAGSASEPIDLTIEDYGNPDLWKLVSLSSDAAEVRAYIRDSVVEATGDITLDAVSSEDINALTAAGSVSVAAGSSTSVGVAGAGSYAENRINTQIQAFVDGGVDADTTDTITADNLELHASDSAQISATTAAAAASAAFGSTGVAISMGISAAYNVITNQVDAFLLRVDGADIEGDIVIDARSLPVDLGLTPNFDTDDGPAVVHDGDLVRVLAGHEEGGAEGRVYRYRGFADFLSTDGGGDNDTTDTEDDDYSLHLLTGSLIAKFDAAGNKTIYQLVEAGHVEDDEDHPPLIVGPG